MEAHTYSLTTTTSTTKNNNKITEIKNCWSLISFKINKHDSSIKRQSLKEWMQKQDHSFWCIQETHST
jgi:translation initiation factor IF-3